MIKVPLKKITVLYELLPFDSLIITNRAFEKLQSRGHLDQLWPLVSTIRALQYHKHYYAYEQPALIAVAAKYWPLRDINLIVTPVKTKPELFRLLVDSISFISLSQQLTLKLPSWHQERCRVHGIEPIFSMNEWANVFGKHRTSVYERKSEKVSAKCIQKVDLKSALHGIPIPNRGDDK